jgi:hypothetical protein
MATFSGNRNLLRSPSVSLEDMENYRAQNMGELRRGFTSGRIGVDANAALADLASARADENTSRAAELEGQIGGLRNRQEMYAPRVGRVEDIRGVGDAADWAKAMVGQGTASMMDPIAAATAASAVGTGLRFIPTPITQAIGTGLQTAGAFAAPYAINQRQLKGEFYGQAMEDPEIMRNYTAQELNTRANYQGAGAAALDSVVPAVIGRGFGAAGLRSGLSGVGPAARTVGGMAMEGATELGQGEVSRFGLRDLNPNRVEENLGLDRLNEFAGGAVGAGPFTAAGAYADAGFRRVGATAEQTGKLVKEQAGSVVDMYDGSKVQSGVDAGVKKAKGLFNMGKDTVIDLRSGKVTADDIKTTLKNKTKGVIDTAQQAVEERSLLMGDTMAAIPADAPDFDARFLAEEDRRSNFIAEKLESMTDDPVAQDMFDRIFAGDLDRAAQVPLMDEAADYILQKDNIGTLVDQTNRGANTLGRVAAGVGKGMGFMGRAAWDVTKSAAEGFNEGRKRNMQTLSDSETDALRDDAAARGTGQILKDGAGSQLDSDAAANRNVLEGQYELAAAKQRSFRRAELMSEFLSEMAKAEAPRYLASRADANVDNIAKFAKDIGAEIADLADSWTSITSKRPTRDDSSTRSLQNDVRLRERQRTGQSEQGGPQSLLKGVNTQGQFDNLTLNLNRIANSLNNMFDKGARDKLKEMSSMASPESQPFFLYMDAELEAIQSKDGARYTAMTRRAAQDAVVSAISVETRSKLMKEGINLNTPEGKRTLLGMAEAIATGRADSKFDAELARVIGRENLDNILEAVTIEREPDVLVDDGGPEVKGTESGYDVSEDGDIVESLKRETNMIQKQGERAADTRSGGRLYGFYGMDKPRTDKNRDPLRGDKTVTAKQLAEWDESVKARRAEGLEPDWDNDPRVTGRPRLIPMDGTSDQRAKKLMEARLRVNQTPERMLEMLKVEAAESTKLPPPRSPKKVVPKEQRGKPAPAAPVDGFKLGPNRAIRDVGLVEQKMAEAAAGDEQAKAWLADRTEAFFTNRAGAWRVVTKSAADIMRDRNVDRVQVLSMYRDYMRQEAARNEKSASTARKNAEAAKSEEVREQGLMAAEGYQQAADYANYEARVSGQALMDTLDQNKSREDGQSRTMRIGAGIRKEVFGRARDYFENNGVVVAERLSDRDPNVLSEEDILELGKQGEKVAELARRDGAKLLTERNILIFNSPLMGNKEGKLYVSAGQLVYNARQRRMMSEPMDFEGTTDKNLSNRAKNEEFLSDLMDGLGMMIASGQIKGLPTFRNADGEMVSFKDRIPEDLMLATSKFSGVQFARQQRVDKGPSKKQEYIDGLDDFEFEMRRQGLVALDQARREDPNDLVSDKVDSRERPPLPKAPSKAEADRLRELLALEKELKDGPADRRVAVKKELIAHRAMMEEKYGSTVVERTVPTLGINPAVSDARMEQEPSRYETSFDAPRGEQFNLPQVAVFDDLSSTVSDRKKKTDPSTGTDTVFRSDARRDNRTDRKPREAKVDSEDGKQRLSRADIDPDNATPLDFFPAQKQDEIRDEFAEQRRQSVVEGKTTQSVRSVAFKKGRMDTDGVARGNELVNDILGDPTTGAERVLDWMRLAQRDEYDAGGGVIGGLHLAMPAAVALNRDTISTYSPDDQAQFVAMRGDLARIIKASDAPMTTKIALMRAMASEEQAAKITTANYKALLNKIEGEAPDLGTMNAGTRSKREIDAASTKAVADYRANTKPAGESQQTSAKRQPAVPRPTAPERVAALKGGPFGPALTDLQDTQDAIEKYLTDKQAQELWSATSNYGVGTEVIVPQGRFFVVDRGDSAEIRFAPKLSTPAPASAPGVKVDVRTPRALIDSLRALHDSAIADGDDTTSRFASLTGRPNKSAVGEYEAQVANRIAREQIKEAYFEMRRRGGDKSPFTEKQENMIDFLLRNLDVLPSVPAPEVAGSVGKPQTSPSGTSSRKLNAQVADDMASSVDIARQLGFKTAPPQLADVAAKLLTDPDVDPEAFINQSAEGLSYLMASGVYGEQITEALSTTEWAPVLAGLIAKGKADGLTTPKATVEARRVIVERALRKELALRSQSEKSFSGRVLKLVRDFISKFKGVMDSAEFADVVRNSLNQLVEKTAGPIDLQANFKRVTFQEAVDADPAAAAVLAHLSKDPAFVLTGSIVLAANGSVYRNSANMLHDLDFVANTDAKSAEAHLRSAFPGAFLQNSFETNITKVYSYIVPPPGAQVVDVEYRTRSDGAKLLNSYRIVKDGREIGRRWVSPLSGETKLGEAGTFVDFFVDSKINKAVSTIPFQTGGKNYSMAAVSAGDVFSAKLAMGREKDIVDYVNYVPSRGRALNAQSNNQVDPTDSARRATPEEMQAARDFIKKVLGPQIKVDFKDITGYAGEWLEAQDVIEIATTSAPGAMQVAYHEALHAFFSKFAKNDPVVRELFQTLVMDPELNERTLALLSKYPAAVESFKGSAEERLAYMFQFWNAGLLPMPQGKPRTAFQKLKSFFRRVLGRVSDSERAMVILEAFREGKLAGEPSDAAKVIASAVDRGTWTTRKLRKVDNLMQRARSLVLPAQTILNTSDSATAQKLGAMFWTNPGEAAHGTEGEGYLNARMRHAMQYKNRLSDAVRGLNENDLLEVTKYLQMEQDNLDGLAYKPQRDAAKKIRGLLQRFRKYMVEDSGVEMGDRGEFSFPRVWNTDALFKGIGPFTEMLKTKYDDVLAQGVKSSKDKLTKDEVAQRIFASLVSNSIDRNHLPPSRDDGVLAPFFAQKEMRELAWLDSADAEPFLEKNMVTTLTQYFHNGARSAEYVRRFGNKGEKLEAMLENVEKELKMAIFKQRSDEPVAASLKSRGEALQRQMKQIHTAVGAMEGTLGKDISDLWRDTSTWATVYQNIRLLPLTLFASVVDPLGIMARGGEMKDAFDSFKRGMTEVGRSWKQMASDNPTDKVSDKWEQLARDAGIVDAAMFAHFVSDEYSSVYMSKKAKTVNDKFFQLNGMEGWNRGVRAGATKAAAMFIKRHKNLPDVHSKRWLTELGLTADDIQLDADGELITNWRTLVAEKGMSEADAQNNVAKMHYALSRWVHGAIITPNAAQRPGWSSDPHYSMFFHLKQFMYSFHMTLLKRAVNEMQEGNLAPIAAFSWYIPAMIASDITKGLIQGGGELPPYMKAMDPGEWVLHGIERAGLLGVGTIGVDASQDIFSLGGPMVEQIIDSFGQELGDTTLRALPANPLYANWVD